MTRDEAQPAWERIVDKGYSDYKSLSRDERVWFNLEPLTIEGLWDHYMNTFDMVVEVHPEFKLDQENNTGFVPFKFHLKNPYFDKLKGKDFKSGFEIYQQGDELSRMLFAMIRNLQ